jgi:hypothetical protein
MSDEEHVEDLLDVEDYKDLIEVDAIEDVPVSMGSIKKKAQKRRKTSDVWNYFYPLPSKCPNDDKPQAKCKYCDATNVILGAYGTGNLKRHIKKCSRRNTHDVGQLPISRNQGSLSVIKYDLPFQFVEYESIIEMLQYLQNDVPLTSRNTVKSTVIKMYQREKQRVKFMLNASPRRVCLTSGGMIYRGQETVLWEPHFNKIFDFNQKVVSDDIKDNFLIKIKYFNVKSVLGDAQPSPRNHFPNI